MQTFKNKIKDVSCSEVLRHLSRPSPSLVHTHVGTKF